MINVVKIDFAFQLQQLLNALLNVVRHLAAGKNVLDRLVGQGTHIIPFAVVTHAQIERIDILKAVARIDIQQHQAAHQQHEKSGAPECRPAQKLRGKNQRDGQGVADIHRRP